MLTPFLLVGVGGSGGKTLRTTRDDLARMLKRAGWNGPFPEAWQFLHIDVPTIADGIDPDLPGPLPVAQYKGLVGAGMSYQIVDGLMSQALGRDLDLRATAGWRPPASQVSIPIDQGAGQFRAIGRVIAVTHLGEVKGAIENAVARLRGPDVQAQLAEVATLLGSDPTQQVAEPFVIVCSSIAGGSGAGAIIDVFWALRSASVPANRTIAMLYAPDVFDSIPPNMRQGVRPNALATLAELCSGWWNNEGISSGTNAMYDAEGLAVPAQGEMPNMILVGRSNPHVTYTEQNDVYNAMGRALSALMTNEHVLDTFTAYVVTNAAAQRYQTNEGFPVLLSHQRPPFGALGFSRVSLGRDRFADYATQHLARRAVDTVLRKHETTKTGPNDRRSNEELINADKDLNFTTFRDQCGLNERTREHNDVTGSIAPYRRMDYYEDMRIGFLQAITNVLDDAGTDVGFLLTQLRGEEAKQESLYYPKEVEGQNERAREWVEQMPARILGVTASTIAQRGIRVTEAILRHMIETEIPAIIEELRLENNDYTELAGSFEASVWEALNSSGMPSLRAGDPAIDAAAEAAARTVFYRAELHLRELAVELLSDLKENVLVPLSQALAFGAQKLTDEERPIGAVSSEIERWPTGDQVPNRLMPSENEFLLESPSNYPAVLEDRLSVPSENLYGPDAKNAATEQIITGARRYADPDQTLITIRQRWQPKRSSLRGPGKTPQRASFLVHLGEKPLLQRAEQWAQDRDRPLGQYLAQSLAGYLDPDSAEPAEASARMQRFESLLAAAISAATPLVSIDSTLLQQVHATARPSATFVISPMPFPSDHPAREVVQRVFSGAQNDQLKATFDDAPRGSIELFSMLETTLQPVVLESLMKPIAEDWAAARGTAAGREDFWRWRRARPLTEFLPMTPAIRQDMVRGWFTAGVMKALSFSSGEPITIRSHDGEVAAFPYPLLQVDQNTSYETLPHVLKSIVIAWLDTATQRDLKPMLAYKILRDYGASGAEDMSDARTTSRLQYKLNPHLEVWLRAGDGLEANRQASLEYLTTLESNFAAVFRQVEAVGDPHRSPRVFELRTDIEGAFADLRAAIQTATSGGSGMVFI